MCLCRKCCVFLELQNMQPGLLRQAVIAIQCRGFAKHVESFGHVRFQLVGTNKGRARFAEFSQLYQSFAQAIKGFGASRLNFSFDLKLFGGLVPLLRSSVKLAKLKCRPADCGRWRSASENSRSALGTSRSAA